MDDHRLREGMRAALPLVLPTLAIGVSFGVLAEPVIGGLAATTMSIVVFAGSAQMAAVTVLDSGGAVLAAVTAGVLLNLRFLPMSLAVAPWLTGGRLRRSAESQLIVDASLAIAGDGTGRFDRALLVGSWIPQAVGWIGGTLLGVLVGDVLPDPETLGLDAVFPAFFLYLLVADERQGGSRRTLAVIGLAAAITLALMPCAPAGLPVIVASAAALLGLLR